MDLKLILTGQTEEHVTQLHDCPFQLHQDVWPHWNAMRSAAASQGFDLWIASGFRNFQSQLRIWNLKATGKRTLLDSVGQPIDFNSLDEEGIIRSILRWSALPAASRHHWGTDFDVFDRRAVPPGYSVKLTPEEVAPQGIFGPLHEWLDKKMGEFGFFRPYQNDLGGISPERWHLSFAPIAETYMKEFKSSFVEKAIRTNDLELKETVLSLLPQIWTQYITNISLPNVPKHS